MSRLRFRNDTYNSRRYAILPGDAILSRTIDCRTRHVRAHGRLVIHHKLGGHMLSRLATAYTGLEIERKSNRVHPYSNSRCHRYGSRYGSRHRRQRFGAGPELCVSRHGRIGCCCQLRVQHRRLHSGWPGHLRVAGSVPLWRAPAAPLDSLRTLRALDGPLTVG